MFEHLYCKGKVTCKCELCTSMNALHVNSEDLHIYLNVNMTSIHYKLTKDCQVHLVTIQQYQIHLLFWLKLEQKRFLEQDYVRLLNGQILGSKSKISQLHLMIDQDGVHRIQGRIVDRHKENPLENFQHYEILLHPKLILAEKFI